MRKGITVKRILKTIKNSDSIVEVERDRELDTRNESFSE